MAKINLRDYYPFYNSDIYIEIPDDIAAVLQEADNTLLHGKAKSLENIVFSRLLPKRLSQSCLVEISGIEPLTS